jgi:hypothetical protein
VGTANAALVAARRQKVAEKIDGRISALKGDIESAKGDAGLRSACLTPLEALKARVHAEESLAHITQAEAEALGEFDVATRRIEDFARKASAPTMAKGVEAQPPKAVLKQKRVVKPSELIQTQYLETKTQVDGFLDRLRMELEQAIDKGERVEIR